ncbi:HMA2 domain-containing protein [Rhodovibrionaceae bacterium A322]
MSDMDILLKARDALKIAKHEPGRIRLKFGLDILDKAPELKEKEGRAKLRAIDGIEGIEINPIAFSLVVTYDEDLIAPDTWEALIDGSEEEAEAAVAEVMAIQG